MLKCGTKIQTDVNKDWFLLTFLLFAPPGKMFPKRERISYGNNEIMLCFGGQGTMDHSGGDALTRNMNFVRETKKLFPPLSTELKKNEDLRRREVSLRCHWDRQLAFKIKKNEKKTP